MSSPNATSRLVVGVDGTSESVQALAYAADIAECMGATLDVVIAYETSAPTPTGYLLDAVTDQRTQQIAYDLLDETVEKALPDTADLVTTRAAIRGRPGDVLVARAVGAEMLVIGAQEPHGPLAGVRLGSATEQCVRHSPCPVLVVRRRARQADAT